MSLSKAVGQELLSLVDKAFKQKGLEEAWPPLKPSTVASRRRGSSQPLQDTGALRRSFSPGKPGSLYKITATSATVGTENHVAAYHEFGTPSYTIRPRNARTLAFRTEAGHVFARIVRHPGVKRRRMLPSERLADDRARRLIDGLVEKARKETGLD